MRIAHLLAPAPMGGLEQVVGDLALGLARVGAEVHLILIVDPGASTPALIGAAGSAVTAHLVEVPPRAYASERRSVSALLRRLSPDVVHSHGYRADVIDSPMAVGLGIPRVSTVHGFTGGGWKNRLYEKLQRRSLRGFERVVAVSKPLGRNLMDGGVSADRLRVIPNARILESGFLPAAEARVRLGVDPGLFHVGWVGRLSGEKGPDVLLDALGALVDADIVVTFLGGGPQRASLEAQAGGLPAGTRVRFAGPVQDAATLLRAFDLVVLSSRTEGTPLVLLEAMAAGVPVVATRVGGVPDTVSPDEALLVPPEDPDGLAAAIDAVRTDVEAAQSRARRAELRFLELCAPGPWVNAYLELYREVTRGR